MPKTAFINREFWLIFLLILFILPVRNLGQDDLIYSNASLAEKIYLQLDGKVYTTENIVWFKSIVTNAYTHFPSVMSRVLYVELISPDKKILEKKLIKLDKGIGESFFYLGNNLRKGQYLIRAYTEWNKNFGTDFFFEEYIQVFTPEMEAEMPISNVTLNRENPDESRIAASFEPLVIDILYKNDIIVIVTLDNPCCRAIAP